MNDTVAKTKTAKPYSDSSSIERHETTKAVAGETNRLMQQTYSEVTKNVADFNLQWIEMVRANTNSAFDFSRQLIGVKSPSEFLNCRPRTRASSSILSLSRLNN